MAEGGVFAGEDDVAMAHQFVGARQAIAVNLGDGRFGKRPQPLPSLGHAQTVDEVLADAVAAARSGVAVIRGQVIAGAKAASRAADYQHTGLGVVVEGLRGLFEFRQELRRQRVDLLRTIERDAEDLILDPLIDDRLIIGHAVCCSVLFCGQNIALRGHPDKARDWFRQTRGLTWRRTDRPSRSSESWDMNDKGKRLGVLTLSRHAISSKAEGKAGKKWDCLNLGRLILIAPPGLRR
jgi:hypothetical protein